MQLCCKSRPIGFLNGWAIAQVFELVWSFSWSEVCGELVVCVRAQCSHSHFVQGKCRYRDRVILLSGDLIRSIPLKTKTRKSEKVSKHCCALALQGAACCSVIRRPPSIDLFHIRLNPSLYPKLLFSSNIW